MAKWHQSNPFRWFMCVWAWNISYPWAETQTVLLASQDGCLANERLHHNWSSDQKLHHACLWRWPFLASSTVCFVKTRTISQSRSFEKWRIPDANASIGEPIICNVTLNTTNVVDICWYINIFKLHLWSLRLCVRMRVWKCRFCSLIS